MCQAAQAIMEEPAGAASSAIGTRRALKIPSSVPRHEHGSIPEVPATPLAHPRAHPQLT